MNKTFPSFLIFVCLVSMPYSLKGTELLSIPYDSTTGEWSFNPQGLVSRNDTLYTTPSSDPWQAMPTGGGDFSAMVSFVA